MRLRPQVTRRCVLSVKKALCVWRLRPNCQRFLPPLSPSVALHEPSQSSAGGNIHCKSVQIKPRDACRTTAVQPEPSNTQVFLLSAGLLLLLPRLFLDFNINRPVQYIIIVLQYHLSKLTVHCKKDVQQRGKKFSRKFKKD